MKGSPLVLLRRAFLAVSVVAALAAALVPSPLSTQQPPPPAAPRQIPFTDVYPLGANFFLDREVEYWKKEQTLRLAHEMGVRWVKMMLPWEQLEPHKGQYWDEVLREPTWKKFDETVELADKYGMHIIARLDRPPNWSRQDNSYPTAPPDSFEDYGNFVYNVVEHFRGRIQFYQIWNEPNIWPEWGDRPVDPAGYVEMLKEAYRNAKEADPNAVVLAAPLAQTLERSEMNLSELDYLEAMYEAGAKGYFDILLANAYGFERPPTDPPDPNVLNFSRLRLLREVMVRHGDADKPIWLNEFGWNASPEDFPAEKLVWRRVTEEQQAAYAAEAIRLARSWDWLGVVNVWYFRQVGDKSPTRDSDYYFRIVDVDFTPRLIYYSLKELSQTWQVAQPGRYEETTAAVQWRGNWWLELDPAASGSTYLASVTPGDRLRFDFNGTHLWLRAATSEDGGGLHVWVDGRSAGGLPRDRTGHAYLNLRRQGARASLRVLVAAGLDPGRHTLELEVAGPREEGDEGLLALVDGFDVESHQPSFFRFYAASALVAVGLLGYLGSRLWFRGA